MNEVIPDLFIQVDAVSYHHKAWSLDAAARLHALPQNHLGQHDHGNGFAAALGMPNNTISSINTVLKQNSLHALFNCKILLVSADFLHIVIVDDKVTNQIQQSLRVQQRHQCTILLLDLTIGGAFSAPIIQPLFVVFMPGHEIFSRCAAGAIQNLIRIHCYHQLRVAEQVRDIFLTPVTDVLVDAFHHVHTGFLTFNDHKGDAVDQHHDIRASKFTVRAFYFELICHLECIIFRVFKVDKTQIKGLTSSVRQILFHALAGTEKLIDRLVFSIQSSSTELIHGLHGFGDGASGKVSFFCAKLIRLVAQKRLQFFREQNSPTRATFFLRFTAGDDRISQFFNDFQSTILGFRSFIKNGMVWHYDPSFILAYCHIFALIYIPGILF